jgi:hypothetical protein
MTDWPIITEEQTDPGAPLTSDLVKSLNDKPSAIAEGADDATRIVGKAMAGTTSGTMVQRNVLAFGNEFLSTGDSAAGRSLPQSAFTALVACTVQVYFSCAIAGTGQASVMKNGVSVHAFGTVTGGTLDVTLAAGDSIGILLSLEGSGSGESTLTVTACQYRVTARSVVMT